MFPFLSRGQHLASPRLLRICGCVAVIAFALPSALLAADWPPTLDAASPVVQAADGREIERYTHGPRAEWGYPESAAGEWVYAAPQETGAAQQNHNSFYLVYPKVSRENAPMCVVLHSANRTAYDYLGFGVLGRKIDGGDDPAGVMTKAPDDFYTLFLSSTNAEWWGWGQVHDKKVNEAPPAERRVLDTVEWIVQRYNIDRNRIYLCGVSMGGCGTLGLGIPHGEVFAAIGADVPAGTAYASYRMGGFSPTPVFDATADERDSWVKRASAVGHVDPPVICDFSSPQDGWSVTQPALVQAAQYGRLPLMLSWGPFGHTTFSGPIARYPIGEVTLAFPWFDIRKNESYPVFTHASCDQQSPWLSGNADFDGYGQMNAYFRWKSVTDTPAKLALQLWIEHPPVTSGKMAMPDAASVDITPRRLQQFRVGPGQTYTWSLTRDGKPVASGKVKPDACDLLTVKQIQLTTSTAELTIEVAAK